VGEFSFFVVGLALPEVLLFENAHGNIPTVPEIPWKLCRGRGM
jgi:hypothetical protein